jgi:hypothetical protein
VQDGQQVGVVRRRTALDVHGPAARGERQRALNSAAPTLCTSSRPNGSMLVRCRVRSALTSRPSAWTMNRQGWLLCSDGASMARSTAALSASAAGVQPAARRRCSGRVVGHPDPRPRSRWLVPGPKSVVRGSSDPIGGEALTEVWTRCPAAWPAPAEETA